MGGKEEQTLKAENNGPHTHTLKGYATHIGTGEEYYATVQTAIVYGQARTDSSGKGEPFSIMPPYIVLCAHVRSA